MDTHKWLGEPKTTKKTLTPKLLFTQTECRQTKSKSKIKTKKRKTFFPFGDTNKLIKV